MQSLLGTGEVIYRTSTAVGSTAVNLYNDFSGTSEHLASQALEAATARVNGYLDHPESFGSDYSKLAVSAVAGKAISPLLSKAPSAIKGGVPVKKGVTPAMVGVTATIVTTVNQCKTILKAKSLCSGLLKNKINVRMMFPNDKWMELPVHCVTMDDLKRLVPDNVLNIPSENEFIPSSTIRDGYKYKFTLEDGTPVEIKWHSPDRGNALKKFPDGYSANMWTAQIKVGEEFLGADGF